MPVHFEYHDVDNGFIAGMIEELPLKYSGKVNINIPQFMSSPEVRSYGPMDQFLPDLAKKMFLRSSDELNIVQKYLDMCERVIIPMDKGGNNLIRSVMTQIHMPKNFTEQMFRHQLASYFVESVDFLYPIMRKYLDTNKLTFSSYVMAVYHGTIWADEFIIGAISMLFNIRISIISPLFSNIWHVYHDGAEKADVVLVCNGTHFGIGTYAISHFTATKGKEQSWKCVGAEYDISDIGLYSTYSEGRRTAIELFSITLNRSILVKSREMLLDINNLCRDVKEVCNRRDELINRMQELHITIGCFQRYTSYYEVEDVRNAYSNDMPIPQRTTEIFLNKKASRCIPKIRIKKSTTATLTKELEKEALSLVDENFSAHEQQEKHVENTQKDDNSNNGEQSRGSKKRKIGPVDKDNVTMNYDIGDLETDSSNLIAVEPNEMVEIPHVETNVNNTESCETTMNISQIDEDIHVEIEVDDDIEYDVEENVKQNELYTIDIDCLTKEDIENFKVTVKQNVNHAKLTKPVPEAKRNDKYYYCDKCAANFKERRHRKEHCETLCPYLTEVKQIKCPFEKCGRLFKLAKTFKDHLSAKHGSRSRYQCQKCGEQFSYQKSYSRHLKQNTC